MSVIWICRYQIDKLGHDCCGRVICGKEFRSFEDAVNHLLVKHTANWQTELDEIVKNIFVSSTGMDDEPVPSED